MKYEYARSHRGFAATIAGLMVACFLSLSTLALAAPAATNTKNSKLPNKEATVRPAASANQAAVAAAPMFLKAPLTFEANQGQRDSRVKFSARGQGYGIYLTESDMVLALRQGKDGKPVALRMKLAGANPAPTVTALDKLETVVNYFIGNDPAKWRSGVPTYGKVKYEGVYPGVDLVYYGNQRRLEYDFIVAPGVDPSRIKLNVDGADKLAVDGQGNLVLNVAGGELRFFKPHVYQMVKGVPREIDGGYVLRGERQVAFEVGKYNKQLALVIDPVLTWSTYLGGTGLDVGNAIALDSVGKVVMVGTTLSDDLKTVIGTSINTGLPLASYEDTLGNVSDAFIVKLLADGTDADFWTYFGGNQIDAGNGVALDSHNDTIYVTGSTNSTDFPLTASPIQGTCGGAGSANCGGGGPTDAFITKFNSAGAVLTYSTYLGGGSADSGNGIALDDTGAPGLNQAYIVGTTGSSLMGTAGVAQQTYGGGSTDAFVAKFNSTGSALVFFTYLGGTGDDSGSGIAARTSNGFYMVGSTSSTDIASKFLPQTPAATYQPANGGAADAFVVSLNGPGVAVNFFSYLGGTGNDEGKAIAAEIDNDKTAAYVTGITNSANFPTTTLAYDTSKNTGLDAFVTQLDTAPAASPALVYSTFLGGSQDDRGLGIALDKHIAAEPIVATVVGTTVSTDFPSVLPIPYSGTVDTVVALEAVTWKTGNKFLTGTGWNGRAIRINSVDYTVESVTDDENLTLTASAGAQTDVNYMVVGGCVMGGDTADAFVTKLKNDGKGVIYSACLGGSSAEVANAATVDATGNVFLTGSTASALFPGTVGAYQDTYIANTDAFVALVAPSPVVDLSTALLSYGNVWVPPGTGSTLSVTVTNLGDGTLNFTSAVIGLPGPDAADYTVVAGPGTSCPTGAGTLLPQDSCVYYIQFLPAAPALVGTNPRTATLTITDDDGNVPASTQTVSLTGNAVNPPVIAVTAPVLPFGFGSVHVGSSSAAQPFTVTNNGAAPADNLDISSVTSLLPAVFVVSNDTCTGVPVAPAGTCTFDVTFSPNAVGLLNTSVDLASNDPGTPTYSAAVSGTGTSALIEDTPDPLAFGNQTVGYASGALAITITNNAAANENLVATWSLTAGNTGDFAPDAGTTSCVSPTNLAPGASCTIGYTFTPGAAGLRSATLTYTDNDAVTAAPHTTTLSGTGVLPTIGILPSPVPFVDQLVNTTSTPATDVVVSNSGAGDLHITNVSKTGDFAYALPAAGPAYCTGGLPIIIPNAGSCTFTVTFTPTTHTSPLTGTLVFTWDPPASSSTVNLSGNGVWPEMATTPDAWPYTKDFGDLNVNHTSSPPYTITITNTTAGGADLNIASIALGGANADQFELTTATGPTACPIAGHLDIGATCTVDVAFKPTTVGDKIATLTFTDDYHENAIAPPTTQVFTLNGKGTAPHVLFTPSPLTDFADTIVGKTTAPQIITLKNDGTGPLTLTSWAMVTGTQFAIPILGTSCTTAPMAVFPAAGSTCTISVTFTPRLTGELSDSVRVLSDATNPTADDAVSGKGIIPVNSLSPNSLDFGSRIVNTQSDPQTVTLTNVGDATLTIESLTVNDADFLLTGGTCAAAPHVTVLKTESCTLFIAFKPMTTDAHTGSLLIVDDAAASPEQHTITLSGTGTGPILVMTPSVNYGDVLIGGTPSDQTIVISNTGNANLNLTSYTITGDAGFTVIPGGCTLPGGTVAGPGSCNVTVRFTPVAPNVQKNATFTLTDNATLPAGSHTTALTGMATQPQVTLLPPTAVDFPDTVVGHTSAAIPVTLTNSGNAPMTVITLPITGTPAHVANFAATGCVALPLAAGNSCTINVTFTPSVTSPPARSASLDITTPGAPDSPHSLVLSGDGVQPHLKLTVTSGSLTFGQVRVSETSPTPAVVKLENDGSSDLTVTGRSTDRWPPFDNAAVADQCTDPNITPITLHPTDYCQLGIVFKPTDRITYSGGNAGLLTLFSDSLSLTTGLPTSPDVVTTTGQGVAPVAQWVSPTSPYDFLNVRVGESAQQTVVFKNNGDYVMNVTSTSLTGDFNAAGGQPEFQINALASNCPGISAPGTLALGVSCNIVVNFAPTRSGLRTGQITINDDAPVAGSMQVFGLRGTGISPQINLAGVTAHGFGNVHVGTPSSAFPLNIQNSGTADMLSFSLGVTGDFSYTPGSPACGATLALGATCQINVIFTPTDRLVRTGTLTVTGDAWNSPQTVALTGTGTAPVLTLTPTSVVAFPNTVVGQLSGTTRTFTVTNTGNVENLVLSSITTTGDFSAAGCGAPAGTSLAPGVPCTITISFTPTVSGARTGAITIASNAASTSDGMTFSGNGIAPHISLSLPSWDFGNQPVGTSSSPAKVITLTNDGDSPLTVSGVAIDGDFTQTNNCTTVAVSCTLNVTFSPTAAGARTGTLTITSDATNNPQTVLLSGTGTEPAVLLGDSSLSFLDTLVNTTSATTRAVTLSNNGLAPLTFTILAGGDFSQTNDCTSPMAAGGGPCTITVSFHPTLTGLRNGAIIFTDNAPGNPHSVTLSGNGIAPAVGLVPTPPAGLTFAARLVNSGPSAAQLITVTNTGTADLHITTVAVGGDFGAASGPAEFAIQTSTCPDATLIPTTGTCTISVTFTPRAVGTRLGAVTITDDAGNVEGTTQSVSLTGTGIAPVAGLAPARDFESVNVGTTSTALAVTLTNSGDAPLTVTGVAVSGDYAIATGGTCPATFPFTLGAVEAGFTSQIAVVTGSSCTINITFTPTVIGTRAGTLTVTDDNLNVAGSKQSVALTGTGKGFSFSLEAGSTSVRTVNAGNPATYNLVATAAGGFTGNVQFVCSSSFYGANIVCTVSPENFVFGPDATSVNLVVSVATVARAMGAPLTVPRAPLGGLGMLSGQAFLLLLMMLIALAGLRNRRAWVLLAATLLFVTMLAACGGGGVVAPAAPLAGTPAGTYTISVTGRAVDGTTVTVPLTLIVN
jgi:hypothetical protein